MGGWARLLGTIQRIDLASSLARYRDEIEGHHDWPVHRHHTFRWPAAQFGCGAAQSEGSVLLRRFVVLYATRVTLQKRGWDHSSSQIRTPRNFSEAH
jgi:hypothetical protein